MYAEDPLVYHEKYKAKWAVAFVDSVKEVRPRIREITLPLFIMHGTADRLVTPAASQFVYDNISSQDKTSEVSCDNITIHTGLLHHHSASALV